MYAERYCCWTPLLIVRTSTDNDAIVDSKEIS